MEGGPFTSTSISWGGFESNFQEWAKFL